jgi:hypothetical protein
MSIQIVLANFVMCFIWLYMSTLFVRIMFYVLSYLVEMREKRMKTKIDSTTEHDDSLYQHNEYFHKHPIYVR